MGVRIFIHLNDRLFDQDKRLGQIINSAIKAGGECVSVERWPRESVTPEGAGDDERSEEINHGHTSPNPA